MYRPFVAMGTWPDGESRRCIFPTKLHPPEELKGFRGAEKYDFTLLGFPDAEAFMQANSFPSFASGEWDECMIADPVKHSLGPCEW
jgi:hypothetical protein